MSTTTTTTATGAAAAAVAVFSRIGALIVPVDVVFRIGSGGRIVVQIVHRIVVGIVDAADVDLAIGIGKVVVCITILFVEKLRK